MFKKEDLEIVTYVKAIINNAYDKNVYLTRFLTPKEQEYLIAMCGNNFELYFDGGYDDAKLKRCLISSFEVDNPQLKVEVLKLETVNDFYLLKHPTVKWHFLNLGIDERMFGDIITVDKHFMIVVCDEIVATLQNEVERINKCQVSLTKTTEAIVVEEKAEHLAFSSSLRLDGICSKCFNLSRKKAQNFIENERVKVNGNVVSKISSQVNVGDNITVTGIGKVIINNLEVNNKTKRYRIYHYKYLRR